MVIEYNKEQVRQQIEFESADIMKTKEMQETAINNLKRIIGTVEVQCPRCKKIQLSESIKNKKCEKCGTLFQVYPKNKMSNLTKSESNMKKLHLIHQWYSLEKRGKYMTIM